MATSEVRAKAAAARGRAIDVLINAFNRLDKLDEVSAGDIVDAFIAAAQASYAPMLFLQTSAEPLSEHAQAVQAELVDGRRPGSGRLHGTPLDEDGGIRFNAVRRGVDC